MKTASMVAVLLLLTGAACVPDYGEEGNAPVFIRITDVSGEGGGGGAGSGAGTVLNSDVLTNDSVFNDNATLTVANISKNQNNGLLAQSPALQDVVLERYEVRYVRSDGRDEEGVDVPFRITGPMTTRVPFNDQVDVPIVIVRHQAKSEPPLRNLRGGLGGAFVLTTSAVITIHGRTIAGEAVSAEGRLQITFADFGDQ